MASNIIVTNEAEWDAAITTIDANGLDDYTITLAAPSGVLSLAGNAPAINTQGTVTIIGNGETLNGAGMVRGIFVSVGTVVVQDLTIANMTARGGDGGPGGGGGAGLGGGLMVMANANAVLDGVTFINDSAIGGNGGAGIGGGGGGLGSNGGASNTVTGAGGLGGGSGLPGGLTGNYSGASGGPGYSGEAGFGGGGGSGSFFLTSLGGFGGGGGGGYTFSAQGNGGGKGTGNNAANSGGGGGLGAGGAIFLDDDAGLTIISANISGGSVAGGTGANGAGDGAAVASAIYLGSAFYRNNAITLAPPQGQRVTIADSLADATTIGGFRGSPLVVQGAGTVDFLAANTIAADITIDGGTLLLGTATSAGTGAITFTSRAGQLAITGAAMPANVISGFGIGDTIDLQGITASGATASVDSSGRLTIPTAAGSVALALDPLTIFSGGTFNLAPDGSGGTKITTSANPVGGVVTVTGATGGVFAIGYASTFDAASAPYFASQVDSQITQNLATRATVTGAPLPNVPSGQSLVLYESTGVPVVLPDTVPASLFSNAPGITTVTSGATNADLIVVGDGGLNFTAGLGIFNLFAGRGQKTVNIAPGVGGGYLHMGDGDATINAIGGNNNLTLGNGNHSLTLGIGNNAVQVSGNNTIMGGPGDATIYNGGTGGDLVLLGSGANSYTTTGSATVGGGSGSDGVYSGGAGSVVYFAGTGTGYFQAAGTGTVVGNSGMLQAYSPGLLFAGAGATTVTAAVGTSTVVGNPAGPMVMAQTSGTALLFAQGATTVQASPYYYSAPTGTVTVLGISGTLTTDGARGLFLAAPGGNNHINVSSGSTVFGAAAGDVLSASDLQYNPVYGTQSNILVGGAGAETISGAGSTALNTFFAGSGPEFIRLGEWSTSVVTGTGAETIAGGQGIGLIAFVNGNHPDVTFQGFNPSKDYLTFINFGTGEAAAALAGAQTVAGSEVLTLSDGTHITFQGFTGLTAANIL